MNYAIVMAAGKGTRMKTAKAKTMHELLGKPMVGRTYDTLKACGVDGIVFVVGHGHEQIENYLQDKVSYAIQQPQLGTGHAVMQAEALKGKKGKTLIINGDCPLISVSTYQKLLEKAEENQLVVLTMVLEDPANYGRIVRDESGQVLRIVERKDCSDEQIKIREVNAGIYCVDNELLWKYLPEIGNDNRQHEYYVTDLIEIFNRHGHKVTGLIAEDAGETQGINSRRELAMATKWLCEKTNGLLMDSGVTIIDPARTLISPEVRIGQDTVIYPNVRIEGDTVIGENCIIEEGCVIVNCRIGNDVHIVASRLINSEFSDGSRVYDRRDSEL
ncbi:MAG: NTP transferase domain-containing protein [Erysipelotrichaceae bacterium]|nr:NTP transferase domain-containing protein [Erysipelotrichaceae bacterium]